MPPNNNTTTNAPDWQNLVVTTTQIPEENLEEAFLVAQEAVQEAVTPQGIAVETAVVAEEAGDIPDHVPPPAPDTPVYKPYGIKKTRKMGAEEQIKNLIYRGFFNTYAELQNDTSLLEGISQIIARDICRSYLANTSKNITLGKDQLVELEDEGHVKLNGVDVFQDKRNWPKDLYKIL